jgi:hypothetical protein
MSREPHGPHTGVIVSTRQDAKKLNLLLGEGAWAYEYGFGFCGRRLNDVLILGSPPENIDKWVKDWVNEDLLTCLTPDAPDMEVVWSNFIERR